MSSISARAILLGKVREAILAAGVGRSARLLVAVSAGADSTALLSALQECTDLNLSLTAVHVEHGIRSRAEGEQDISFLERLAERLGVELLIERIEGGKLLDIARVEKRSVEEVARQERYARLRRVAALRALTWIAVAHTLDDQLETVVMRLFQGGLLQGLSGIPSRRDAIIRPLLRCSRSEVVAYLASRGLRFRTDPSNSDERYLRNRVRRRLLPVVDEIFPAARSAVETFSMQIRELNEILDACGETMLPWREQGGGYAIDAERFLRAPGEIRVRSVLALFNRAGKPGRIPRRFLRPLETVKPGQGSARILRGHGATVDRVGHTVYWRPDVVLKTKKSYLIRVFEPTTYHITPTFSFRVSTVPAGSTGDLGIGLPEASIRYPLVVRSRKPGDTIQMQDGAKSLKKLFSEWGVQESLRDLIPVIEDRGGVVGVGGGAFGYRNRLRDHPLSGRLAASGERMIVFAFDYAGDEV